MHGYSANFAIKTKDAEQDTMEGDSSRGGHSIVKLNNHVRTLYM